MYIIGPRNLNNQFSKIHVYSNSYHIHRKTSSLPMDHSIKWLNVHKYLGDYELVILQNIDWNIGKEKRNI